MKCISSDASAWLLFSLLMADFLLSLLLFQWVGFTKLIQVVEIKGKLNIVLKVYKIKKRHENRDVNKNLMAIKALNKLKKVPKFIIQTSVKKKRTSLLLLSNVGRLRDSFPSLKRMMVGNC